MLVLAYLLLIPSTLALNILLSSSNSWASKNIRHLQYELELQNHNVVLVAPLYNNCNGGQKGSESVGVRTQADEFDGGEFGHLLKSHQAYYRNLKAAAAGEMTRGAKGVVLNQRSYKDFEPADKGFQGRDLGQDPLNLKAWFVNNTPTKSLLIALDIILPKFYPDFELDLIILGPEEGSSLTSLVPHSKRISSDSVSPHEEMARLAMVKNIPTICIATEDRHNVYYQDEKYFDVTQQQQVVSAPESENNSKLKHHNRFTRNIKFVNSKIIELLDILGNQRELMRAETILPNQTSLNINFPSMNHDYSRCFTSRKDLDSNPKFAQIVYDDEENSSDLFKIPLYIMTETGEVILEGEYSINVATNQKIMRDDSIDETYIDTASLYFKHRAKTFKEEIPPQDYSDNEDFRKLVLRNDLERLALRDCLISVTVNNLENNGLGRDYFDLGL